MRLAAGGTAGTLLGVEITGTEAAAGPPLGLLVAISAAAALVASRRTSRVGWGRSLALGYVLGASCAHYRRIRRLRGLCTTGEAFVYAAMARLMARRLARV